MILSIRLKMTLNVSIKNSAIVPSIIIKNNTQHNNKKMTLSTASKRILSNSA